MGRRVCGKTYSPRSYVPTGGCQAILWEDASRLFPPPSSHRTSGARVALKKKGFKFTSIKILKKPHSGENGSPPVFPQPAGVGENEDFTPPSWGPGGGYFGGGGGASAYIFGVGVSMYSLVQAHHKQKCIRCSFQKCPVRRPRDACPCSHKEKIDGHDTHAVEPRGSLGQHGYGMQLSPSHGLRHHPNWVHHDGLHPQGLIQKRHLRFEHNFSTGNILALPCSLTGMFC